MVFFPKNFSFLILCIFRNFKILLFPTCLRKQQCSDFLRHANFFQLASSPSGKHKPPFSGPLFCAALLSTCCWVGWPWTLLNMDEIRLGSNELPLAAACWGGCIALNLVGGNHRFVFVWRLNERRRRKQEVGSCQEEYLKNKTKFKNILMKK